MLTTSVLSKLSNEYVKHKENIKETVNKKLKREKNPKLFDFLGWELK